MAQPPPGLIPTLRGLLDRAARAALHRLAGGRNLLYGWASLDPTTASRPAVEARCREDRDLLARLDWLRETGLGRDPDPAEFLLGDRAQVLLAAVLGLEGPAACAPLLGAGLDGERALAAACWAMLAARDPLRWHIEGRTLRLGPVAAASPLPAWWMARFGGLSGVQVEDGRLVVEAAPAVLDREEA